MALGIKFKQLKTVNSYSIQSFFEAIKDKEFSAGKPEIVKHGITDIIVFPPLDTQNQVQIVKVGFSNESNKFQIQKAEQAGVGNMMLNQLKNKVTGGVFGLKQMVGSKAKECEQLVEETLKELEKLGL